MGKTVKCNIVRAEGLEHLFPLLADYGKIYIVCDRNVFGTVGNAVVSGLPEEKVLGVYLFDATEDNKRMGTVEAIVDDMLEKGADRNVFVLGIGGGITTDVAGFAASIYKRGVRFAFVPTTLLAQVDAAIGGKNGVNFHSYKNMIGIIRQPEFTYIYNMPLKTLPRRDFLSGGSELLKTFIIADETAYHSTVSKLRQWNAASTSGDSEDFPELGSLTARAAEIKASIVEQDPLEHGLRRVLNLGHTFAHAIEKLSHGSWTHGEAVSAGIILAARLAERLSETKDLHYEKGLASSLKADFEAIGLPTECPYTMEQMSEAMAKDKKADGACVNFVLPLRLGEVKVVKLPTKTAELI